METLKLKLKNDTDYLTGQIAKFEKYLNESNLSSIEGDQTDTALNSEAVVEQIPDYAIGNIRLAIGQSNLFINERFKQFSNLMADSEAKRGEKEIKLEDLEGFWEMIHFQVDDLKVKWDGIENLRKNNWIHVETAEKVEPTKAAIKNKPLSDKVNIYKNRKAPAKTTATTNGDKPKAPAARSNFRDFLRSKQNNSAPNKNDQSNGDSIVDIKSSSTITESSNNDAIVVTAVDKEN